MNANFNSMSFGFGVVNAGQRNTSAEPLLVAVSTEGSFRITAPVSLALGLTNGDNVMFLSNVDNIDQAILQKDENIKHFCEEQGLEFGSDEARIAIHKTFDAWAIAKGIKEFDEKGNVKECKERLNKNDKVKYAIANFDEMLEAAMQNATDEVKDALSHEGVTKEEQVNILAGFVIPRSLPKYKGSKTANPAGLSGAGIPLTFTDSNVWKQLKFDMEDATSMNREFEIDIETLQDVEVFDGYKTVTVKALTLGAYTDKEPNRVGRSKDEDAE